MRLWVLAAHTMPLAAYTMPQNEAERDPSCRRPRRRMLAVVKQGFAELRLQNPAAMAVKAAGRQLEPQVAAHRQKATAKKLPQTERAGAAIPA
jgi:hypothetical protein